MCTDAGYPYLLDRLPVGGAFIAWVVGQPLRFAAAVGVHDVEVVVAVAVAGEDDLAPAWGEGWLGVVCPLFRGQRNLVCPVGIGRVDPRLVTIGRAVEGDPRTVGGPVGSVTFGDGLPAGAVGPHRFDAVSFFDAGEEGYLGAVRRPGRIAPGAVL